MANRDRAHFFQGLTASVCRGMVYPPAKTSKEATVDQKKGSPPDFRKKPPEGVVEVIDQVGRGWSIVERRDGTLFAVSGRHWRSSSDDGCSWSDPEELSDGIDGAVGLIRLGSGTLMLSLMDENRRYSNRLSRDEGQSWEASHAVPMLSPSVSGADIHGWCPATTTIRRSILHRSAFPTMRGSRGTCATER